MKESQDAKLKASEAAKVAVEACAAQSHAAVSAETSSSEIKPREEYNKLLQEDSVKAARYFAQNRDAILKG